ncbi:MAG TPA: OB-fold nucleic acid binding domain-containing protein, partial [Gammaproteobacteria bacterium]|nr:OB-fold nucleic acid binding domain-containing protein [Gammaproteobacteria bacterium]
EAIIVEREAGGPFKNLLDLCRRVDSQKLNRRVLEALVRAGALDELGPNRPTLVKAIPDALRLAEHSARALAGGQGALFGGDEPGEELEHEFEAVRDWTKRERRDAEYESLGLFLTSHPFEDYAGHCSYFTNGPIAGIVSALPPDGANAFHARREVIVGGVVMEIRRRGGRLSIMLDDDSERIEVSLFDEVYSASKQLIAKHAVLVVRGQLRWDDFIGGWRVTAQQLRAVDDEIEEYARRLTIEWRVPEACADFVPALKEVLKPFARGKCEVSLRYRSAAAEGLLTLGEEWAVRPTRELRESLTRLLGEDRISIHYPKHFVC